MTKKITKREMFAMVSALVEKAEVENKAEMLKFIEHEIELLDNKKSKSGQSKTQKENEILKEEIFAELSKLGEKVTVSEFQAVTRFAPPEFSNQKISALLNQMEKAGRVGKVVEKKKSYFFVPKAEQLKGGRKNLPPPKLGVDKQLLQVYNKEKKELIV